jgi:hypothetical protein
VIGSDRETAFHPTLQILNRSSGAVVPWASFPMGHGKDHNLQIVCTKNDVERKSTKNRSAEVSVELESCWANWRGGQSRDPTHRGTGLRHERFTRRTRRQLRRHPAALPDGS